MIVSNRQRHLLEVLLKRQAEVTAGEIAAELRISTRTVHREIQELEPILMDNRLSLVKKSGIGISIHGEEEDTARFKRMLGASISTTYSSEERKTLILCHLLEEAEPVKLYTLARMLHAAIPTVTRDLDELEPQLQKHGLALIRRRGYGVEINGEESMKRSLIALMIQNFLDESDLFGSSSEVSSSSPVTHQLLRMAGKNQILNIEQLLWKIEEGWTNRLSDTTYTRLLIQLSVAFTRMRKKFWIDAFDKAVVQSRSYPPRLEFLSQPFGLDWPDSEKIYVQRLIDEAKQVSSPHSATPIERYGITLVESVNELIRIVGKEINVSFDNDRSLLDGLIRHLGPALERLRLEETIRNPLLSQIRKDYAPLFAAVRSGVSNALRGIDVPDEEIGYLVMHFGASIERLRMFPRSVRALIVCTSGIGSSKLLAVRINKEIPQIGVIGYYSWYEAVRIPQDRYDFIISTVDLPLEPNRYIKLSPLLTKEETEKLRSHIHLISAHPSPTTTTLKNEATSLERLKRVSAYTSEIVQILEPFKVYNMELSQCPVLELRNVLTTMLAQVSPKVNLRNEKQLVEQLIEREKQGSQLITGTKLALFHTRNEWVLRPFLSLFILHPPLYLGAEGKHEVRQILLMLAPRKLERPALEVLSEISAMLLMPEMIRLLEDANEDAIKTFISQELETFMRTVESGEYEYEYFIQRKSEAQREGERQI